MRKPLFPVLEDKCAYCGEKATTKRIDGFLGYIYLCKKCADNFNKI